MRTEPAARLSDRQLAVSLMRHGVRSASRLRHRVNRENLERWRSFRRAEAFCPVCGHRGTLLYELPDLERIERLKVGVLRQTLRCRCCTAKMSGRALAATVLEALTARGVHAATMDSMELPPDVAILAVDAHHRMERRFAEQPGLVRSIYPGGTHDEPGMLTVDLERLSFPDDHFDVVVTSEVLEHVRHIEVAHREIARCLKPGGVHVFTVPFDPELERTWELIDPVTDAFLVDPPHIHGDPMVAGDAIKSYRVFGRDLVDQLRRAGLEAELRHIDRPEIGVFGGEVFVARKQPVAPPVVPQQGGSAKHRTGVVDLPR